MCTQIATKVSVVGSATRGAGWAAVNEAIVTFDHATHAWVDHALRLDFTKRDDVSVPSVAVELDLASGRALLARLAEVIAEAERSGLS